MDSSISARWSNDHILADHRDVQANCMGVNYHGSHAVLAGRKAIAIIDLDKPQDLVKKIPRQSKWEVSSIEWCPTSENANMFALCCNQKAELLRWREGGDIEAMDSLRAHTRVITDMNWSSIDCNLLATCSVDTYTNIWDMRDPKKPCTAFSCVAGASQVKWNKLVPKILATSHESDVRLWDIRKGNSPVQYISAHSLKIHGLDWSNTDENTLATSSQDGKVKFWDVLNPRQFNKILSSGVPVWRARYTPFGQGLITVVVPQLRRGENNLNLWNIDNMAPIHNFVGHNDAVLEFQWRRLKNNNTHQYQLITWSKDQTLRIWTIDPQLQKACGHDLDSEIIFPDMDENQNNPDNLYFTDTYSVGTSGTPSSKDSETTTSPRSNPPITFKVTKAKEIQIVNPVQPSPNNSFVDFKSSTSSSLQPKSLQQEFSLIDVNIPNLSFEEMNASKRKCQVKVINGMQTAYLQINFPTAYPHKVCPTFTFLPQTDIDGDAQTEVLKVIQSICEHNVKQSKPCLEPCLRQLVSVIKSFSKSNATSSSDSSFRVEPVQHSVTSLNMYGCYQDSNVPFPRTCGARFSGAGQLVCFARPFHLQNMNVPNDSTPRSLSALAAYHRNFITTSKPTRVSNSTPVVQRSQYNLMYPASAIARSPKNEPSELALSMFYSKSKKSKGGRKNLKQLSPESQDSPGLAGQVIVYDVSSLMTINISLANLYVLDDQDIQGMCTKNAAAATSIGRKDLVQVWNLVALCANPHLNRTNDTLGSPWGHHPFGRQMLQSILDHYTRIQDVQTVAMLCCALGSKTENQIRKKSDSTSYSPGGSPYHTIHSSDTNMDEWNVVSANLKTNRSNSWSDSLDETRDELKRNIGLADMLEIDKEQDLTDSFKLLDPKLNWQYDLFKKIYANLLYHWNLLIPRAQVLKYFSVPFQKHKGIEFLNQCHYCKRDVRGPHCLYCKNYSFQCVICHVAVKGSSCFCLVCGHGGHTLHLMEWFQIMEECPSGCGCYCMEQIDFFE